MLKVKKHKILRKSSPIPIFKNEETPLIDKDDFQKKLKPWRYRFRRHHFSLVNLRQKLKRLEFASEKSIGRMTKIRVKDFVLDQKDGRIYAVAVTFCRSGKSLQKQLEIEYSGYITSMGKKKNNNEKEVISGVIALSSFIYNRFRKFLTPTVERKFDFVTKGV